MERIHFENLSWNWNRITFLIIAILCFVASYGSFFEYNLSMLPIIGFLIVIIFLSKRFWFKNYVDYNKLGIVIKFHFIKDKTIKFNEIGKIIIDDTNLNLSESNGRESNFEIDNVCESDKNKLIQILVENSNCNFIDNRSGMNTIANNSYKQ
jgi:hypothetical protein